MKSERKEEHVKAMKPVKIYSAPDRVQADMMVNLLKNSGIPAYKQGNFTGGAMDIYTGNSVFGEEIYVDEAQKEEARQLLENIYGCPQEDDLEAVKQYTQKKKLTSLILLAIIVLVLLFTLVIRFL